MAEEEQRDTLAGLPDSSGSANSINSRSSSLPRRPRRAYAAASGRELSTSAKKRQSVIALGSIRHLQHQFAKSGLQAKEPVLGPSGKPLPLAIPGSGALRLEPFAQHELDDLPPLPDPPSTQPFPAAPEGPSWRVRRDEVWREIADVCERWGLVEMGVHLSSRSSLASSTSSVIGTSIGLEDPRAGGGNSTPASELEEEENLILSLLQTTTSAIRATQRYFLSLPPEKLPFPVAAAPRPAGLEGLGRPSSFSTASASRQASVGVITAARPPHRFASSSSPSLSSPRRSHAPPAAMMAFPSSSSHEQDPLLVLRRASLATLGALKDMEARYRLATPAIAGETPEVETREADELNESMRDIKLAPTAPLLAFDDTSTTASTSSSGGDSSAAASVATAKGHLYRDDVSLKELRGEAEEVRRWIETVDSLLFRSHLKDGGHASGDSKGKERELPDWAKETAFTDEPLARVQALLAASLPVDLLAHLPPYSSNDDRDSFLLSLSDGQLLCLAYNAAVRRSQRPWGFVPHTSIHDLLALTRLDQDQKEDILVDTTDGSLSAVAKSDSKATSGYEPRPDRSSCEGVSQQRVGLTFRRFENLRVFIAALKLRYLISFPTSSSTSPTGVDAKVIARKEAGWQVMLETVVTRWAEEVGSEKRGEKDEDEA